VISNIDSIEVRRRVLFDWEEENCVLFSLSYTRFLPNNCHDISLFIIIIRIFIRNNNRSLTITDAVPIKMFLIQWRQVRKKRSSIFCCFSYSWFKLFAIDQRFIVDFKSWQMFVKYKSIRRRIWTFITPWIIIERFSWKIHWGQARTLRNWRFKSANSANVWCWSE